MTLTREDRSWFRVAAFVGIVILVVLATTGCGKGTRIKTPTASSPVAGATTYRYDLYVDIDNRSGNVCGRPIYLRVFYHSVVHHDRVGPGVGSTLHIPVQQYPSTRDNVAANGYIVDDFGQEHHVGSDTKPLRLVGYERLQNRRTIKTGDPWRVRINTRGFECPIGLSEERGVPTAASGAGAGPGPVVGRQAPRPNVNDDIRRGRRRRPVEEPAPVPEVQEPVLPQVEEVPEEPEDPPPPPPLDRAPILPAPPNGRQVI